MIQVMLWLPLAVCRYVLCTGDRAVLKEQVRFLDGRAVGLYLTETGAKLMADAERTATALEEDVTQKLSAAEKKTLMRLLQKIYL